MATTVLLGLDGATFTVLDPLMERGVMPFLAGLTERGVRAPLRTVMPPLTPPAWTSLMTGKRPGQHGVFDFFQKEDADSEYLHLATSQDVGTPMIWSLASEADKRIVSLNFPLMFPPPPVNGSVVPGGWMPWRQLRLGCYPPGLFDRLKRLPSFEPSEMALDMELEAKAIDGCPQEEYADWIRLHTRREERWFQILRHLLTEDGPADLVGIMFDGTDKLQHLCWRFIDAACRPAEPDAWEQEIIDLCEDYFRGLDAKLEQIVAMSGADPTVVIASDHGFGPTWDLFYVNAWLEQAGYLAYKDAAADGEAATAVGFAEMTRHVFQLDWERTSAYAATPSSQGINVVRRRPDGSPVSRQRHAELCAEIAAGLREIINPVTGRPVVLDVLTREEAYAGPYEALGPDLSLVLADGAAMSILRSAEITRRRPQPCGNHQWQGVFIAAGPGIRAGERLRELSILDVAPTLLYALDVAIPQDMTGHLATAAFEPEALRARPPRSRASESASAAEPAGVDLDLELDAEEEQTIVNRLKALGYVE